MYSYNYNKDKLSKLFSILRFLVSEQKNNTIKYNEFINKIFANGYNDENLVRLFILRYTELNIIYINDKWTEITLL